MDTQTDICMIPHVTVRCTRRRALFKLDFKRGVAFAYIIYVHTKQGRKKGDEANFYWTKCYCLGSARAPRSSYGDISFKTRIRTYVKIQGRGKGNFFPISSFLRLSVKYTIGLLIYFATYMKDYIYGVVTLRNRSK